MFVINKTKKAVLFDMDGTLINIEPVGLLVFVDQLNIYGIVPTEKETQLFDKVWRREGAVMGEEAYLSSLVAKYQISKTPEKYIEEFYDLYERAIAEADELPGTTRLLEKLAEQNFYLALVTTTRFDQVKSVITYHGWTDLFSVIITEEDTTNLKPNAEPYQAALTKLALKPDVCLAIEDTWNGILSAKKAGLFCVGVKAGNKIPQDLSNADVVVESLNDIYV